ncbi:MAG: hypothetical protein AAFZ67_14460 [Planctomycetota bacterium]
MFEGGVGWFVGGVGFGEGGECGEGSVAGGWFGCGCAGFGEARVGGEVVLGLGVVEPVGEFGEGEAVSSGEVGEGEVGLGELGEEGFVVDVGSEWRGGDWRGGGIRWIRFAHPGHLVVRGCDVFGLRDHGGDCGDRRGGVNGVWV